VGGTTLSWRRARRRGRPLRVGGGWRYSRMVGTARGCRVDRCRDHLRSWRWFTWGTATAFRNVGGHIALASGAPTFVPDYRLAPEHRYPAAVRDLEACYRGLLDRVAPKSPSPATRRAVISPSFSHRSHPHRHGKAEPGPPWARLCFSPITDLSLSGDSYHTRAEADLYFTRDEAATLVQKLLGGSDTKSALASPSSVT